MELPPPGLQGTYEGSCVICLQGCDTALVLQGEAEWIVAGLMTLGLQDLAEAMAVLAEFTGGEPGRVPDGLLTVPIRCCEACVARSDTGMRVGPVASPDGLPCYRRQR